MRNTQFMSKFKVQKPFLKWVGGKTQIISDIMSKFPCEINNYHEIFLGGGSVLLALLSLQKQHKIRIKGGIYACDINETLINVYKHIQNNKDELFSIIARYIEEYDNIQGEVVNRNPLDIDESKTSKESYYYWMRKKFNHHVDKTSVERAAMFMFLNKTCFRGVYREGPNGYNVPYGHYKRTPTIITRTDLDCISDLIKDVEFVHCDFRVSIKNVKGGDFVYLDPPYAPKKATSFVGYTKEGFGLDNHKTLFSEVLKFNERKIKFVMSNAKVDLVVDAFKGYDITDIVARRAIHSKKPGSTTMEVIINN